MLYCRYLRPVVGQSTIVETKAVPLESLNQVELFFSKIYILQNLSNNI